MSTGGTAKALAEAGLAGGERQRRHRLSRDDGRPRQDAASQDPRRHPRAPASPRRSRGCAAQHGIGLVDLVVVNLYPFVETAAKPGIQFDDLIEQIDIGGPSLVRAAAKNFRDVLIVVSPEDYDEVIAELDRDGGPSVEFRFDLARRAFAHTGGYDTAIAGTLGEVSVDGDASCAAASRWRRPRRPSRPTTDAPRAQAARPALRREPAPARGVVRARAARPVSARRRSCRARSCRSPTCSTSTRPRASSSSSTSRPQSVIKHTNPCGVATGASIAEAYVRARDADPLAAFGGIIGLNRPIDEATAKAIVSTFIEAVVAPAVERGGAPDPRDQSQSPRARRRLSRRSAAASSRVARFLAPCSCSSATR